MLNFVLFYLNVPSITISIVFFKPKVTRAREDFLDYYFYEVKPTLNITDRRVEFGVNE